VLLEIVGELEADVVGTIDVAGLEAGCQEKFAEVGTVLGAVGAGEF